MLIITIKEILNFLKKEKISYQFIGNENNTISGFSSLSKYRPNTMTWVRKTEKLYEVQQEVISLLIVQEGICATVVNQIITPESKRVFFLIIEHFFAPILEQRQPIGENCYISSAVHLGKGVIIGHGCVLDGDIFIDDNTHVGHNVIIINHVSIGKNCVIQPGCVIGIDGYAYTEDQNKKKKMVRHYGGVVIENNVWIGANTNIARGTIDNTVIGENTKVDANVHIAHNVVIGKNVSIIAQSEIMGSVHIGNDAYISTSIIRNQLQIGCAAFVAMGAVVTKDVPDSVMIAGVPAKVIKKLESEVEI